MARLAEIEDRQQVILTDLDVLEGQVADGKGSPPPEIGQRLDEAEARLATLERGLRAASVRLREHRVALTRMAELLAAEPWKR